MKKFVTDAWLRRKERREIGYSREYARVLLEKENEKRERAREMERAKRVIEKILALTPLSRVQREVIDMFLEGLSLREIAKARGVYFRAVQKSFQSAVKRMRKTAKRHMIKPEDEDVEYYEEYGF